MSRVRGKHSQLELLLRRALWAKGLRYRLHTRLPGRPDLIVKRAKVAVFVDSCFWHACPWHGEQPQTNAGFWALKLRRNKLRDKEVSNILRAAGWTVVRLWEHQLIGDLDRCVARVMDAATRKQD